MGVDVRDAPALGSTPVFRPRERPRFCGGPEPDSAEPVACGEQKLSEIQFSSKGVKGSWKSQVMSRSPCIRQPRIARSPVANCWTSASKTMSTRHPSGSRATLRTWEFLDLTLSARCWQATCGFAPTSPKVTPASSSAYLEAVADYIARYERLIGGYPYSSFSVVSAPIPVGYGLEGGRERLAAPPLQLARDQRLRRLRRDRRCLLPHVPPARRLFSSMRRRFSSFR